MQDKLWGRITALSGGLYTVRTEERDIQCRARGVFRHNGEKPLVGDFAALIYEEAKSGERSYVIDSIGERKNALIRPSMANLDYIFVTAAVTFPSPELLLLDKLIAIAEFNKIEPVLVITKSELDREGSEKMAEIYRRAGFDVFAVSSYEDDGIDAVKRYIDEHIEGKIAAFAGISGVGKSTLLNKLFPNLGLATAEVSAKTERGRHTTRSVELYPSGGGYIADTPGFSLLDFERFDFFTKEDLPLTFREFERHLGSCKYTKCSHTKEEGCAILEAVRKGEISASRHQSYLALYEVLKNKHSWDK